MTMSVFVKPTSAIRPALISAALMPLLLAGCGSLTGLDASSSFSCPMTPGTACRSLSDTYDDALHGRAPDQIARAEAEEAVRAAAEAAAAERRDDRPGPAAVPGEAESAPSDGRPAETRPAGSRPPLPAARAPQRLPEVIVTIWMAPWTDDEGDFHEGERIHARAFDARWAAARRRADNAQGRRAVVQLPFSRRAPVGAESVHRAEPGPAGEGAAGLIEARRSALQGAAR